MKKVGRFFARLWGKVYPVLRKVEPAVATAVEVIDPKIAPAIIAGQAVVSGIDKEVHH